MSEKLSALPRSTSLPPGALLYAADESEPSDKSRAIEIRHVGAVVMPPPALRFTVTGSDGESRVIFRHGWFDSLNCWGGGYEDDIWFDSDGTRTPAWVWGVIQLMLSETNAAGLEFPDLAVVGTLEASDPVLENLSLPALTHAYGYFNVFCEALDTLSAPALTEVGHSLSIGGNSTAPLSSLAFPALVRIGVEFFLQSLPSLASVDLSSLEEAETINITACASLASVDLSGLLNLAGDCLVTDSALSEGTVDAILAKLVALDGTGGTTLYENHSVDLSGGTSAPPSASGLADKATLEGRGCTVTVNV